MLYRCLVIKERRSETDIFKWHLVIGQLCSGGGEVRAEVLLPLLATKSWTRVLGILYRLAAEIARTECISPPFVYLPRCVNFWRSCLSRWHDRSVWIKLFLALQVRCLADENVKIASPPAYFSTRIYALKWDTLRNPGLRGLLTNQTSHVPGALH